MTEAGFDRHAEAYRDTVNHALAPVGADVDRMADSKMRRIRALVGADRLAAARVLDLGCGIGLLARRLAPLAASFDGIDVSARSLDQATAACPSGRFRSFDGRTLPFAEASFDLVLAINVLHHVPPPERAGLAAEMSRVAAPGGWLVVWEHNPRNPVTRRIVASCPLDSDAHLLDATETAALLDGAGLTDVTTRYLSFSPWRSALVDAVEAGLAGLPWGAQYLCCARKAGRP